MGKFLTNEQRAELKFVHGVEDKRRYADRIKALLLLDSGWKLTKISEALLLDEKTIRIYRKYYEEGGVDRLCCDELQGSSCQLSPNGALDAETKEVVIREDQTLNAESTKALLQTLEAKNPDAGKIYVIVDNARYYRNKKIKEYLQNSRVILMFLPAYAPNLNLIERLWKFFKKKVLANTYYESFALFS